MNNSSSLANSRCHSRKGSPLLNADERYSYLNGLNHKGVVKKMVKEFLRTKDTLPPLPSKQA